MQANCIEALADRISCLNHYRSLLSLGADATAIISRLKKSEWKGKLSLLYTLAMMDMGHRLAEHLAFSVPDIYFLRCESNGLEF
jgi:hypothetical protein